MKKEIRSLHLKNPSAVQFLEDYAAEKRIPLYKAMEMIIFQVMTGEPVVRERQVCSFMISNDYAIDFIKCLMREKYEVTALPFENHKTKLTIKESEVK